MSSSDPALTQSQEQMAVNLHARQSNESRIENRTDMYISTLRGVIKAMGGTWKSWAAFTPRPLLPLALLFVILRRSYPSQVRCDPVGLEGGMSLSGDSRFRSGPSDRAHGI